MATAWRRLRIFRPLQSLRGHLGVTLRAAWSATAVLLSLTALLGIAAGAWGFAPPPFILVLVCGAGLLISAGGRRRRAMWLPGALLVALALGLWRYEATRPPTGAAGLPFYIGRDVTLTGTVSGEPDVLDRGQTVRLAVDSLTLPRGGGRRIGGGVLVHLGTLTPLSYGDRVALTGRLAPPPELAGNAAGYRAYLAAQGIYTVMDYPRLQQLGTDGGNPLIALTDALRALLERGIRRILPAPASALLLGILLGTHTRALGDLTAPFVATGMIHVVSIDGVKVSIFIGTLYAVARRLFGARAALLPALAALLLYVLLTGATPAGLRSAVMWTLALVAVRFGRRSDAATSLSLSAALLSLVTPRILWDLGFQLSLTGTAAIVLLTPGITRRLGRLPAGLREALAVATAAQAGTLPLVAAGFGQVSPIAPLANALLLPLLEPIIALGAPAALAGALIPPLGALLGLALYPFLTLMIVAVQALARLPLAALPSGAWAPLPIVAYYLLLGAAAWGASLPGGSTAAKRRAEGLRIAGLRPIPALCAAVALVIVTVAWQAPRRDYTLTVLPLGGGEGLLLTTPDDHTLLLDGGDTPSALDAALGAGLPFWRSSIDTVALTDVDRAHAGGLRDLPDRYTIGRALDPGAVYPASDYARWRAALRDDEVPERKLRAGARFALSNGATLDALAPGALNPEAPDTPVALRLRLGRLSVLTLNRAALTVDPAQLQSDGIRRDTVVALPSGPTDPSDYTALIRLLRPRLVVLPSPDDAHDDPAADAVAVRAARGVGARVWQSTGATRLELTSGGGAAFSLRTGS